MIPPVTLISTVFFIIFMVKFASFSYLYEIFFVILNVLDQDLEKKVLPGLVLYFITRSFSNL